MTGYPAFLFWAMTKALTRLGRCSNAIRDTGLFSLREEGWGEMRD